MKLRALAERLDCRLEGDGEVEITRVAGIESAGPTDVTFFANNKYAAELRATRAGAVILADAAPPAPSAMLRTRNPYLAFAKAVEIFAPAWQPEKGVHRLAFVAEGAEIAADASIGPFAVIGERARIGPRTIVQPHVVIGRDARIGDDCLIHAGVSIRERVVLGNRVVVQDGAVLGSDGFGFARAHDGSHYKIPQVGVAGHLTIGTGVIATAQTGIPNSVDAGSFISGYPAIDNREWLKASAIFRKLPELRKTIADLERRLADLEKAK